MRTRIPLGRLGAFYPAILRSEPSFLYRRLADQDREVLAVGEVSVAEAPSFGPDGRVLDWTFGHLCYEWGDLWQRSIGRHATEGKFPLSRWMVPRWVVEWSRGDAVLHALPGDEVSARAFAEHLSTARPAHVPVSGMEWSCRTSRETYLRNARRLMRHIQRGDIYELNYCIERTCEVKSWDPFAAFDQMLRRTQAPFAGFHRLDGRFALCASPERFLAFDGARLVGQPMKGTRPRSPNAAEDDRLRDELAGDAKERSENIMALDVMRHDLSRVAASRSVRVDELCAVHSFPQVHQMVSTVSARIRDGQTPFDAVRAAFPMASMTGAPKIRAMELIDEVEDQARGLYSGTLGFFAPDGTADLNVVIRTVLYDEATGRASLSTGSALTAACDPEQEWEECELKAHTVMNALAHA